MIEEFSKKNFLKKLWHNAPAVPWKMLDFLSFQKLTKFKCYLPILILVQTCIFKKFFHEIEVLLLLLTHAGFCFIYLNLCMLNKTNCDARKLCFFNTKPNKDKRMLWFTHFDQISVTRKCATCKTNKFLWASYTGLSPNRSN